MTTDDIQIGQKILVVDDEPGILKYVEDILLPAGYQFFSASGGEEALKVAELNKEKIDLLLTDINMPGVDGLELAKLFQRKYPETKIILMSGYMLSDETVTEIGGREVVFLPKPFTPNELTDTLNGLLSIG